MITADTNAAIDSMTSLMLSKTVANTEQLTLGVKRLAIQCLPTVLGTAVKGRLIKNFEFIHWSSAPDKYFQAALTELGIRARRPYNCRHTYATMCLMAGMNPAFIATQLGHSVQMLLSTYARWINSSIDWGELGRLENSLIGTKLVQTETVPL